MDPCTLTVRCKGKQVLVDFPEGPKDYHYFEAVLYAALTARAQPHSLLSPRSPDPKSPGWPSTVATGTPSIVGHDSGQLPAVLLEISNVFQMDEVSSCLVACCMTKTVSILDASPLSRFESPRRQHIVTPVTPPNIRLDIYLIVPLDDDASDHTELIHITDDLDVGLLK
jgi:hypothetical protein